MENQKNIDFGLPKGTKSYNLYKLHPPFRKLIDGHGYPGVVLERITDGKLQCHICGEWFESLAHHIYRGHNLLVMQYKKKYQLLQKDSLISATMRKKLQGNRPPRALSLKASKKATKVKAREKQKAGLAQSFQSLSYKNKHGLCLDQIDYRFDIIAEQIKCQPKQRDIVRYDTPLMGGIIRTYGTFNKYLEYRKLQPTREIYPDAKLISAIREMYMKHGKVKTTLFNERLSYETIRRRFGSLENACREAGIDSSTWEMVG